MERNVWLHCFLLAVLVAGGCGSAAVASSDARPDSGAEQATPSAAQPGADARAPEGGAASLQLVDSSGRPPSYGAFANVGDVYLTGTLPDGDYYYQVTDRACSRLLAGPSAPGDVPDTTYRRLHVSGGKLEPISLAPFKTETADGQAAYRVHVVPVTGYTFAGPGCYGFNSAGAVTADFALESGPATDPSYCVRGAVYVEKSPLDGVEVELLPVGVTTPVAASSTGLDGRFTICGLNVDHAYLLTVQTPEGLEAAKPADGRLPVTNYTGEDLEVQPFYLL